MAKGQVKWFDNKKGYGFIENNEGEDIFVHYSNIVIEGYKTLEKGELVEFDVIEGTKGLQAENVRKVPE
jgi:CspA family cold shock protein